MKRLRLLALATIVEILSAKSTMPPLSSTKIGLVPSGSTKAQTHVGPVSSRSIWNPLKLPVRTAKPLLHGFVRAEKTIGLTFEPQ